MADVWAGDDYIVSKVSEYTEDGNNYYSVEVQRLPESTYTQPTSMQFAQLNANNDESTYSVKFPAGLDKANFLANALPMINSAFTADDAISYTVKDWN